MRPDSLPFVTGRDERTFSGAGFRCYDTSSYSPDASGASL